MPVLDRDTGKLVANFSASDLRVQHYCKLIFAGNRAHRITCFVATSDYVLVHQKCEGKRNGSPHSLV